MDQTESLKAVERAERNNAANWRNATPAKLTSSRTSRASLLQLAAQTALKSGASCSSFNLTARNAPVVDQLSLVCERARARFHRHRRKMTAKARNCHSRRSLR